MCPAGYPKEHTLAYTLGTSETNPFHFCHGFQVSIQNWTPSPHTWGPASIRCLDLHLSPPPLSWSKKSRSPWQESNKSSHSHKQVCVWNNKSMTWLGSRQRTVLNRRGQGNSATKRCPMVTEHHLLHPLIPIPHPCPVTIFFPPFYCEIYDHNNPVMSNDRLPTPPSNLSKATTRSCTGKTHG
jgi:hypothetical protein